MSLPPNSITLSTNPLTLFDIAKTQKRPLYAAAPMVRYSKLAFRETVARYGVDLTWTPMILAKEFNRSQVARDSDFTISPTCPPTIAQFGASCPMEFSNATRLIAPFVNGVDLNCGCPQSWACAESLGAALMHKRELVASIVKQAKSALYEDGHSASKTISVKIRIHNDLRETVDFIKTVHEAGVDFITIHGRTRAMRSSEPVDLDAIKLLASHITVPTLSNGDVFSLRDATSHAELTGVNGVMAARGLLENPALFNGHEHTPWEALEYFVNQVMRKPIPFKLVVHHLNEMGGTDRSQEGKAGCLFRKDERNALLECKDMLELLDFLDSLRPVKREVVQGFLEPFQQTRSASWDI